MMTKIPQQRTAVPQQRTPEQEVQATCAHPGCTQPGKDRFYPNLRVRLCTEHDAQKADELRAAGLYW